MPFLNRTGYLLCSLSLTALTSASVYASDSKASDNKASAITANKNTVAATTSSQDETVELEKVQVWGTEVTASSVSLDSDSLAIRQADHISDLLRTLPGIDVGGAHSLNQRITIRSMDDKDLDIRIDGANQNTYMYHHMGNLQIHADILESVDIEVGKNSIINGGLGGTVRFRTKSAEQLLNPGEQFGGRVQAGYNSNSGSNIAASGYGKLGDEVDVLLYHNRVDRDNYKVGGGKIKDANGDEVPGTDGEVEGLEGTQDDTLVKFGWNVSDNQRLTLGYERYEDDGDYSYRPDMGLATDLAIAESLDAPLTWPTTFGRDTITLNYDASFDSSTVSASIYDNTSDLERDETAWKDSTAVIRGRPAADNAGTIEGEARIRGANVLAATTIAAHTLTYGLEYTQYNTDYQADYLSGVSQSSDEKSTAKAIYLQDRWQVLQPLAITAGIRYDSVDLDTNTVDDNFSDSTFGLGLEYQLSDSISTRLSQTQLFKAPEVAEVFIGAGINDTENPDLKAETGTNTEANLQYSDELLAGTTFNAGATLFQTEIKDYIYDYAARSFKDNVGDMTIQGSEVYVGLTAQQLSALLTFSRAASDLDATNEYEALDGARIDRQQGNTLSLNLDYDIPALNLALHWDVLNVDDLDAGTDLDGATADNAKDGYQVHNVSARWTPTEVDGLSITAGVDNVFDEFYASQSSRTGTSVHPLFGDLYLLDYEPGRNIKLTVAYDF